MKPCVKCGAIDRHTDGRCRPCAQASSAKYRAAHPEYAAKWYKSNSVEERVKAAKRTAAHPNYLAEWRAANPNYSAEWYAANPAKAKAYDAARRKANPNFQAEWRAKNPEKAAAHKHKRRASKLAAGGTFTAEDIKAMLKQQKGKCIACKVDITKSREIDHVMPLALGGHNGIQNIQLLCQHCNRSKRAKHPITFMQERGYLL